MKFLKLDSSNIGLFDDFVSQDKEVFVFIHMENCIHCINTKPEWEKIENKIKDKYKNNDNLVVVDVDQLLLEKMESLKNKKIEGFPTILYITSKGGTIEDYNGDRKVESFEKWIDSKMPTQKGGKRRRIRTNKKNRSNKRRRIRTNKKNRSNKRRRTNKKNRK